MGVLPLATARNRAGKTTSTDLMNATHIVGDKREEYFDLELRLLGRVSGTEARSIAPIPFCASQDFEHSQDRQIVLLLAIVLFVPLRGFALATLLLLSLSSGLVAQDGGDTATALRNWIALDAPPGWEHLATHLHSKMP